MTLFVVLGAGEMPAKEVAHQLDDLWKQAEAADTDFWFAVEGKPFMSETDKSIVAFFNKFDLHYGVLTTPDTQPDEGYTEVAEYIEVDDIKSGALGLMQMVKGEDEDAVLLSLFSDEPDADRELTEVVTDVLKAGYTVLGLNDSLEPVELLTEEVKPMPEETVEAKPRKSAKRPEAVEPEADPEAEDEDGSTEPEPISRQYLESLTAAEVKEIAKGMGIPPTVKGENIDAILVAAGVEEEAFTDESIKQAIERNDVKAYSPTVIGGAKEAEGREVTPLPDFGAEHFDELPDDTMVAPPTMEELFQPVEHVLVVIHRNSGMQTLFVPASLVDGWINTIGGPA